MTLDNLQPADALAAFSSGKVDAWDIWSPFIEQATVQHGGKVLVYGKQYGAPYSFEVASDAALSDKGKAAAINDYLKIINQATSGPRPTRATGPRSGPRPPACPARP